MRPGGPLASEKTVTKAGRMVGTITRQKVCRRMAPRRPARNGLLKESVLPKCLQHNPAREFPGSPQLLALCNSLFDDAVR